MSFIIKRIDRDCFIWLMGAELAPDEGPTSVHLDWARYAKDAHVFPALDLVLEEKHGLKAAGIPVEIVSLNMLKNGDK